MSAAVENRKLGLDATGRNALFKIHVSLGKIVNALGEKTDFGTSVGSGTNFGLSVGSTGSSAGSKRMKSLTPEDEKTVLAMTEEDGDNKTETIKEEDDDDEGTVVGEQRRDSLVEELLSDEDVEMTM